MRPALLVSDMLHARITAFFESNMIDAELLVSYATPKLVYDIHETCRVVRGEYGEQGTTLRVRAHPAFVERMQAAGASLLACG